MGTQENRQVLGSRECMGEKAIFLILIILELETQELQLTGRNPMKTLDFAGEF